MKLPWVARSAFDTYREAVAVAQAQRERTLDALRRQYDSLLEKYHALRVDGAVVPVGAGRVEPKPVDPVVAAVMARAMTVAPSARGQARQFMLRWVQEQRAMGMDELELVKALERGVDVEGTADNGASPF